MKAMIALIALLGAAIVQTRPEAAQNAGPGIPGTNRPAVLRRWVAITHTWDYLQQRHQFGGGYWVTQTSLFGINGTDRVADVGVYVLGKGQLWLSVFHHLQPGRERRLLPGDRYFGPVPGQNQSTDGQPPKYKGETIVVVSNEPLIVTGAVIRGYEHRTVDEEHFDYFAESKSQASRTLDVRQFDCSVAADFVQVAQFCRNLSSREP